MIGTIAVVLLAIIGLGLVLLKQQHRLRPAKIWLRVIPLVLCVGVLGAPVAARAVGPAAASAAQHDGAIRVKAPAAQTDKTYASREADAKGLETFEGGGAGIYIGGGAGTVIILLLVLIIIF